jgi:deoxyribonuclease II
MLSAISDSGRPVDWWFIYKLPRDAKSPKAGSKTKPSTGYEYLYFDAESKTPLALSSKLLSDETSALSSTMKQLYPMTRNPDKTLGWVLYNDERCDNKADNGSLGHTKGVLAFDTAKNSALWMLHSTPRFALTTGPGFPQDERIYGQTFLCITLADGKTAENLAQQMCHQQEPQVYDSHTPAGMAPDTPIHQLTGRVSPSETDPPGVVEFSSKGGQHFRSIAKNRHWGKDFWNDLVGPTLKADLSVETWRRGTLAGTKDSDKVHDVTDILYIDLEPLGVDYEWHYTQDHAKWAVSQEPDWVCVADINRDTSQEKRGGGTIAFQNRLLWHSLSQIEKLKK